MSILGIDIGTSFCVIATIQRGAVAIVRNDLSERLTPSLVSFTDKERLIGEQAQTQLSSNFRNTCRNIKQLLGCSSSHEADMERERQFALAPLSFAGEEEAGLAAYNVNYKEEEIKVNATRCMAALLTKLKGTAESSTGGPVRDVVISVPGWFSDQARQAMLDAAEIAGLNCLRAMNEHAAIALDYGIYRSNTFDAEKASRVAFVGVGHGITNISVVDYVKGELRVLSVTSDKTFGGRDIDRAIVKHLSSQFAQKYGIDPMNNPKALVKMEEAAGKAKKVLSANLEAPLNIECLIEDYDMSVLLTRQEFETICLPFKEHLTKILETTFSKNGLSTDDVHHIELVGGCTRIPWVQETVSTFFKHRLTLSKTLSMDESVARGCALQAAMLNPRYRVRDFNVVDRSFEEITVSWTTTASSSDDLPDLKTSTLFEIGSPLGVKKWLTFQRNSNFEVRLNPGSNNSSLLTQIELPSEAVAIDLPKRVKLKARLSLHGTVSWEAAQLLIDEEVEEMVKEKRLIQGSQPVADGQAKSPSHEAQPTEGAEKVAPTPQYEEVDVLKKKIKTKRFDCQMTSLPRHGYLSSHAKSIMAQKEQEMSLDDIAQQKAKETMNELEAYIYDLRDKLSNSLKEFATAEEHQLSDALLLETQDWVYDNPSTTRAEYLEKLNTLQTLGRPIETRQKEFFRRNEVVRDLQNLISDFRKCQTSPEFSHVDHGKMQSLMNKVTDFEKWLNQIISSYASRPLYSNPTTLVSEMLQERETLLNFSKTVLIPNTVEQTPETASPCQDAHPNESSNKSHDDFSMDQKKDSPAPGSTTETDVSMN